MDQLIFYQPPKTLHGGVVVTIPLFAHGADETVCTEFFLVSCAQYWLPRSECKISPTGGRCKHTALINAAMTSPVSMRSARLKPTISRLCKSLIPARYTQPCRVGMEVLSLTHTRLSSSGVKSRFRRLGATGNA